MDERTLYYEKNDSRADIMYPPEIIRQTEHEYKEAQCKS